MKLKIYGKLFGNPQIFANGSPIFFSFSKINALLYYLLVNQTATRDEMAGLLWPDKAEKLAKKNLRNTIYQGNKSLGGEVIFSPNRLQLSLHPNVLIESDVALFLDDIKQGRSMRYPGSFLKGFYMKDAEEFDSWMLNMRQHYDQLFTQEMYRLCEQQFSIGKMDELPTLLQQLIQIDSYDERYYQLLMSCYQKQHRHSKAIAVYNQLKIVLKADLAVNPSQLSNELYHQSLAALNHNQLPEKQALTVPFQGREKELNTLLSQFKQFSSQQPYVPSLIVGSAGIGKSTLKQRFISLVDDDALVIDIACYQVEEKLAFVAWKKVVKQLNRMIKNEGIEPPAEWQWLMKILLPTFDDLIESQQPLAEQPSLDAHTLSYLLLELFHRINARRPLILSFDDIQWMDIASLNLLTTMLLQADDALRFYLILTMRSEVCEERFSTISTLLHHHQLQELHLNPFTYEEMVQLVNLALGRQIVSKPLLEELYRQTEGNPFFLIESLSLLRKGAPLSGLTAKMQDILKARFLGVTTEERQILEILAHFYDDIPLFLIQRLTDIPMPHLIMLVNDLIHKHLLVETVREGEPHICFTHIKLREYLYKQIPYSRRRLVHQQIADNLKQLAEENDNPLLLAKISYHYQAAKETLLAVTFQLRYLEHYLRFHHELFPVYSVERQSDGWLDDQYEYRMDEFMDIKRLLSEMSLADQSSETYQEVLLKYYYLEGRYFIRVGNYAEGIADIQQMLTIAREQRQPYEELKGLKQLIYYCIQTDQADSMLKYVDQGMGLAIQVNDHESIGIFLRLKGLNYLMEGDYEHSRQLLNESIATFSLTPAVKEKYALNIAAAYNYLSEIHHMLGEYQAALEMEHQAMVMCQNKLVDGGLALFYINMGIVYVAMGNYQQAKVYLVQADRQSYDSSLWKRTQLDVYLALVYLREQDIRQVVHYLRLAQRHAKQFGNPRDLGSLAFAKAVIIAELGSELAIHSELVQMIPDRFTVYYHQACQSLSQFRDTFERRYLAMLAKQIDC